MPELIDRGTGNNDQSGDSAYVWAGKSNTWFQHLENLLNASTAVENRYDTAPDNDLDALIAGQSNQTSGRFQFVQDARTAAEVTAGDDPYYDYFEYLGTTNGDETDYRRADDDEIQGLQNSFAWKIKTVRSKATDGNTTPSDAIAGNVLFVTDDTNITHIIFDKAFSLVMANVADLSSGADFSLNIYNADKGTNLRADITSYELIGSNLKIGVTGILDSELEEGHILQFDLPLQQSSSSGSGSIDYLTANTDTGIVNFDAAHKGLNKILPLTAADSYRIAENDFVLSDIVTLYNAKASGDIEILADDTDAVLFTGVRNEAQRYLIESKRMAFLLGTGSNNVLIQGTKSGSAGAIVVNSHTQLQPAETKDIHFYGSNFGVNMPTPTVTGNATINTFTYVSDEQVTLNITSSGSESDVINITFYNGDTTVYPITLTAVSYNDYTAWYKFNETSGTALVNENGTNGVINGATINQTGKVGQAHSFDGVDDYTELLGNMGITGFPFTISAIIRVPDIVGSKYMTYSDSTNHSGFNLYLTGGEIRLRLGDGAGGGSSNRKNHETGTVITAGQWQHIDVVATDIDTVKIVLNNSEQSTSPTGTGTSMALSSNTVLGRKTSSSEYAQFEISSLAAWDRALSDTEIATKFGREDLGNEMI